MLSTPSTTHVPFSRVYEPAEDSYLLLDTLSSVPERTFLRARFPLSSTDASPTISTLSPLLVEIGTGSGVVLAFVTAHAEVILGRADVLTLGVDVNVHACRATGETAKGAVGEVREQVRYGGVGGQCGFYLGNVAGDLGVALRPGMVDVLVFNPPYVPTEEVPDLPPAAASAMGVTQSEGQLSFEDESHLLALSYAGGLDGMETTNRLLQALPEILSMNGVAYILLCAQNRPEVVKEQIRSWSPEWQVETVGSSGKKAGWEKLQVIRIWRTTATVESKPA